MAVDTTKTLEELFKFRLGQLKADSEYATGSISQIIRVTSYGLIALIIPFATAKPLDKPIILQREPWIVLLASIFGFISVACDAAQNHYADLCSRRELERIASNLHKNGLKIEAPGDFMLSIQSSKEANARTVFYKAKLISTILGVLIIFEAIINELLSQ